ncbi:MAG TPA: PQQ-binding-like beta-propeller repeat protein, partial [Thermoguttaceae bacterium]|nr:PQQ-binding-like beta-propeller repeat protein [Thermoguttaceae bacterium]
MALANVSAAHSQQTPAGAILDLADVDGGLIVHVGCGDGAVTAGLRAGDSYVVQGLDADPANIAKARTLVHKLGLSGKVSFDRLTGRQLPYIDNLVNLIVCEDANSVAAEEVMRVLAPGGVALSRNDAGWTRRIKPRPDRIDCWTHYLHDASGNAVSQDDVVGPPRHMQWLASPLWSRYHHTLASISTVVATESRIFYIVDEGPAASMAVPPQWSIVGRDAFNGVQLWQRPIPTWADYHRKFRSGPVQLQRTLVASGDRVYLPLGVSAPLAALDGATGAIVQTYPSTVGTEEVILDNGLLLVVSGSPVAEQAGTGFAQFVYPNTKSIRAIQADSGKVLWTWSDAPDAQLMPVTLAAGGGHVFFVAGKNVVCLDRDSGETLWGPSSASPAEEANSSNRPGKPGAKQKKPRPTRSLGWAVSTLVVNDGVVLHSNGNQLVALAADSGATLWQCDSRAGFRSATDVFVVDGLVWTGPAFNEGRDLQTGEIKKTNTATDDIWTVGHHHRCYREKATSHFILTGKRGIEFVDLDDDEHTRNNWVRGACQYGIMPCNGLIYAPSHACGCFMEAKLYGFWALAPQADTSPQTTTPDPFKTRLEKGPAYGKELPLFAFPSPLSMQWPTLRHDSLRSGSTTSTVSTKLGDRWQTNLGGQITAPVVVGDYLLVAAVDTHRVIALDASDGTPRWTFTAGGRIDSPPTICAPGLALFGSADGWVYCVQLADGQLVWRFRAALQDRKTVALDQVESLWPVHGSALVQDGVAYVTAGRSSYLDSGLYLYGLDPKTGEVLSQSRVHTDHPEVDKATAASAEAAAMSTHFAQNATDYKTMTGPDRSDAFSMAGTISDILVGDGMSVYLRHLRFDSQCVAQETMGRHLLSTSRLLDDAENHRSHWVLGTGDFSRTTVAYSWIANSTGGKYNQRLDRPYGVAMSFDEQTVWAIRRGSPYVLFAERNEPFSADETPRRDFVTSAPMPRPWKWSTPLPVRPRAIVHAGDKLILGGMPAATETSDLTALYEGRQGGTLMIASADD